MADTRKRKAAASAPPATPRSGASAALPHQHASLNNNVTTPRRGPPPTASASVCAAPSPRCQSQAAAPPPLPPPAPVPRQIPGFVYDAETNRYFRVSAADKLQAPPAVQARLDDAALVARTAASAAQRESALPGNSVRAKTIPANLIQNTNSAFARLRARELFGCRDARVRQARLLHSYAFSSHRIALGGGQLANQVLACHADSGILLAAGCAPLAAATRSIFSMRASASSATSSAPPVHLRAFSRAVSYVDDAGGGHVTSAQFASLHTSSSSSHLLLAESLLGGARADGCAVLRTLCTRTGDLQERARFSVPHASAWSVALADANEHLRLLALGASRQALVYDVSRGGGGGGGGRGRSTAASPLVRISTGKSDVFHCAFADDARTLLLGARDGHVRQWDLRAPPRSQRADGDDDGDQDMSSSSSSSSSSIASLSHFRPPTLHCASAVCWFVHPRGVEHHLVVACMDSRLQLFDRRIAHRGTLTSGGHRHQQKNAPLLEFAAHSNRHQLLRCALSAAGDVVWAGGDDGRVRAWRVCGGDAGAEAQPVFESPVLPPLHAAAANSASASAAASAAASRLARALLCVPEQYTRRPCVLVGSDERTEALVLREV